jgi:hypothetical protein
MRRFLALALLLTLVGTALAADSRTEGRTTVYAEGTGMDTVMMVNWTLISKTVYVPERPSGKLKVMRVDTLFYEADTTFFQ